MATIVTRAGKGSELTYDEVDANFNNLNADGTSNASALSGKQATLVSGTNIKTINGLPILGLGDLSVATSTQGSKADSAIQPGSLALVALTGAYADLAGVPTAYSLPTASTSTVGGVKIDGTTITIAGGVISASSTTAACAEQMQILSGAGTWAIPAGLARVKATIIGGGGGGGGTSTGTGQTGAGGSSGGTLVVFINVLYQQINFNYSVGIGGLAGAVAFAGGAGGASSITYDSLQYIATGGGGGSNSASGSSTAAGYGSTVNGGVDFGGNAGLYGGVASATNPVMGVGGDACLGLGKGGTYGFGASGNNGNQAIGYGSGGAGGRNGNSTTQRSGGAGANGIIILQYFL